MKRYRSVPVAAVHLHCGVARLGVELAAALESWGVCTASGSGLQLVVDAPFGWALKRGPALAAREKVIVSDNPCPEYRLDLCDLEPVALLSGVSVTDLVSVLQLVMQGAGPLAAAPPLTPLSRTERPTLRLVATGHSNDEIARLRQVEVQTVKNTVRSIYQKLYLKTRVQVAHYYFGNWHLLEGWTPPPHIVLPENGLMARGGA
jgi:DNA-binding CsgD family transcriptional regulator